MVRFKTDAIKWVYKNGFYSLRNGNEIFVSIRFIHASIQECIIGKNSFLVTRKGSWNPSYTITENNHFFLSMKHDFWGSDACITLFDEQVFTLTYSNIPQLNVAITHQQELVIQHTFSFANQKPLLQLKFGNYVLQADWLLLFAAFSFIICKQITVEYFHLHESVLQNQLEY